MILTIKAHLPPRCLSLLNPSAQTSDNNNVLLIHHHPDHLHLPAVHPAAILSKTFLWPGLVLLGWPCSSLWHLPAWGDDGAMWEGLLEGTRGDVWGEGGQVWGVWGRDDLLWM